MSDLPPSDRRITVALMVAATALFASTTLLAKAIGSGHLGPPVHPLMVSFGRFAFAFLAVAMVATAARPRMTRPDLSTHLARTLCGWGGITLMFAAVARMPLPDATAISFLSPVFTMLLAIPLLGERVGPVRWTAAGIALLGAVILLRPGANMQAAALLALGAAAAMGLEAIFIKRLAGRESPLQILLVNNGMGAAIATIAVIAAWSAATGAQWAALAAIGALMACGQALNLLAMRRDDASFVVPFFYLTLIWAALFDLWWFGALPDAVSLLGAAVIVAGALLLVLRDRARIAQGLRR
ncbi:MAG: DMT family transporter [Paracoccus sp. (in: a-proteobacteria)]|uniref:DMT family transporter n=1 Tax=Paracoccus sp. TaxID=267 RepID=UPI0026E0B06A|nr:DMT family transporter [Paracoccus sp. (in: a-proteobacteria)]MDO5614403.1 DMT family transporter [Paracoccus sp. (in: a-proteobacteria)]